jgi:hypothetical protein
VLVITKGRKKDTTATTTTLLLVMLLRPAPGTDFSTSYMLIC